MCGFSFVACLAINVNSSFVLFLCRSPGPAAVTTVSLRPHSAHWQLNGSNEMGRYLVLFLLCLLCSEESIRWHLGEGLTLPVAKAKLFLWCTGAPYRQWYNVCPPHWSPSSIHQCHEQGSAGMEEGGTYVRTGYNWSLIIRPVGKRNYWKITARPHCILDPLSKTSWERVCLALQT